MFAIDESIDVEHIGNKLYTSRLKPPTHLLAPETEFTLNALCDVKVALHAVEVFLHLSIVCLHLLTLDCHESDRLKVRAEPYR